MKTFLCAPVLLAAAAILRGQAPDVTGDWTGALKVSGTELHLVVHITRTPEGKLTGTFDSVDQAAFGIAIDQLTVSGSKLHFTSAAVHGTYDGKVNSNSTSIDGTWSQGAELPLVLTRAPAPLPPPAPSDIDGAWLGTLDFGTAKLRIVFHFVNTAAGLTSTADSPDQGAKGMPVLLTRNAAALKLEMKSAGASFEGKIAGDRSTIEGTFTQGPNNIPLVLKPVKDTASLQHKRPQNPVKPYPYREEDVTYRNESAGFTLAATLTLPQGAGPFPAVVLITGSGPQDRDESLLDHKPFLVLADHLTRKGIAVLRADDRGVAKSGGNFATATSADFATDAEAGLAYLKTRPEIDARKIGLVGHSEGGMIAPMIAARNPAVAFIVMMAGTGVSGAEVLPAQVAAIAEASGESHDKAAKLDANERQILALIQTGASEDELLKKMAELAPALSADQRKAQITPLESPWFRYFLPYDPATALRKVKCPVLALNGEKDMQVLPGQNLPAIRKALTEGGNQHFEVEQLAGLNHLFQTAKTGAPGEYAAIEETLAPVALNRISSWILRQ